MTTFVKTLALFAALIVASGSQVRAQTAASAAPPATPAPLISLRVQVVISKYQDEKKVMSLPYTLAVTANDTGNRSEVARLVQVLIPMITVDTKTTGPVYKDVGTTIKCGAWTVDGGRFKVELIVEDSSVYPESKIPTDGIRGPWLQSFRSMQTLLLKDGQTMEYTTATDKVSGEVFKVEVTLSVMK